MTSGTGLVSLLFLPVRNPLVLAGDCNSVLLRHVGPAATAKAAGVAADKAFVRLLRDHGLCALNTWVARPHHTFESHHGKSQIDFIIARLRDSRGAAKQAKLLHSFPVGAWHQGGRWPLLANVPITPFNRRPHAASNTQHSYDKKSLQAAVANNSPEAMPCG